MNQTLIIVPTVNERENLPRSRKNFCRCRSPVDLLVVDGNSSDGTGPTRGRTRGETSANPCPARAEKKRAGPRLHRRLQMGVGEQVTNSSLRWTAIFRTTRMTSRNFLEAAKRKRRPRARLALLRRRARGELAAQTADVEPQRGHLRPAHHRDAVHRPDGRLQMLPPPRAAIHQSRCSSARTVTAFKSR